MHIPKVIAIPGTSNGARLTIDVPIDIDAYLKWCGNRGPIYERVMR